MLWTPLAEIAEKYLTKGGQVYIEGKLTSRSYDDKEGITRYRTEVVGREMTLLGSRPSAEDGAQSGTSNSSSTTSTESASSETEIDDLPF